MKVIQVIPRLGLAGAETMCENLTRALLREGCQVILVSLYRERTAITRRLEAQGADLRWLDKRSGPDPAVLWRLYRLFRREKPDVVHSHLYASKYAQPAAVLAGVPRRVHTVHNMAEQEAKGPARRLNGILFRRFGVVPAALSETVRETIVTTYRLPPDRVPVVPNGIGLSRCVPKTDYAPGKGLRILHIGRFSEQKNHKNLLEGFRLFHAAHPDSTLWLVGEGNGKAAAEQWVKDNYLSECVAFLGLREDVFPLLAQADLFLLPSLWEGAPMTLIEAMAAGLPVIASPVGGVPDMLTDGETGLFCGTDASSIAAALARMADDPALRERCGKAGRASAARFSAEAMASGYLKVYGEGEEP